MVNRLTGEKLTEFVAELHSAFAFEGDSIVLGGAMVADQCLTNTHVKIPLSTLNRHGLIAGSSGTGKTKSVQVLAEQLSAQSVPVLLMDIKGDLSGIAKPGEKHSKVEERMEMIGNLPFKSDGSPVEFLTISDEKGARLRVTVTEFGPVLFSKILDLNQVQQGIVADVFRYCDDNELPLLDLPDFRKTLQWLTGEGKKEVEAASLDTIIQKLSELEELGADKFFGERSFEVDDLVRINEQDKGMVSIVRLTNMQDRPNLFSTFMLHMLAEIYASFPEVDDLDQPKLVIFIDEAHLVFNEASDASAEALEAIIKSIRSKGVGIVFITQNPAEIPDQVLMHLGFRIQHALRASTAEDYKAINLAAQKLPLSDHYEIDQLLTELGIGQALVTVLTEQGKSTPLARTMMRAPQSSMEKLSESEVNEVCSESFIVQKYSELIDRESAYEILSKKMAMTREKAFTGHKLARELTRGLLGALGLKRS